MISALLILIVLLVLLALFIGKNISYNCPIWFFKTFDSTNVAIIVFLAFAAGIIFTLLVLLLGKLFKNESKNKEVAEAEEKDSDDKKTLKKEKQKKDVVETSKND
ncbi:MAG: hypothetical protein MJ188_03355 [Treponema sp.]|nr:hypothetical protein [Treponema sp.]